MQLIILGARCNKIDRMISVGLERGNERNRMNKRKIGTDFEVKAVTYLMKNGMKIVECNFRNRQGEIDIIGIHNQCLVFTEVKYRRNENLGFPSQAVDYRKQSVICKVADYYRYIHNIGMNTSVRYDVVAICGEEIKWYQNAFYHIGNY